MKKFIKILCILIILLLLVLGGTFLAYKKGYSNLDQILNLKKSGKMPEIFKENKKPEEKKLKIFDQNSKERPISVMIDNNVNAWPHSGINSAYVIYEIEVEGGESRLMALFKNRDDLDRVGPIRSARHYFIDYAMEHDCIYSHLGLSPYAKADFKKFNIDNINGQLYDTMRPRNKKNTREFWRDKTKYAPHNAYTSIKNLYNIAKSRGYKVETDKKIPFKYSLDEIDLEKEYKEKSFGASKIYAGHNSFNKAIFEYDKNEKKYKRYEKGKLQVDALDKKPHLIKNLLIIYEKTNLILGDPKGRINVTTTGENKGKFFTNGRGINIVAKKDKRTGITKYFDEDGKEIKLNDGTTFVYIISTSAPKIKIEDEDKDKDKKLEDTNKQKKEQINEKR